MVTQLFGVQSAKKGNNFVRPEGQNVGNFLGDRPSSRVLAAPGGNSNFSLGNTDVAAAPAPEAAVQPLTDVPEEVPAAPVSAGKLSFLDKMTAKIAGSPGKAPLAPLSDAPTMQPAANTMVRYTTNLPSKVSYCCVYVWYLD